MKGRFQPSRVLLGAVVSAGLAIGVARWCAHSPIQLPEERTPAAVQESETSVGDAPAAASTSPASASRAGTRGVQKRDALLEKLRSKLEAPNVVPREALLTFRDAEARERFAQQAAGRGLEILDVIAPLNTARVRYGRLEDLRDSMTAGGADFAGVEGNLWLGIPPAAPQPDPNNQGGRAPFGYNSMSAINAAGDRSRWGDTVTVAVLDTGVLVHPTFAEGQITRLDLVNDGQSFHSHGTSVASLVGGQNPQAPGVAPGAQILDVRVANAEGVSVGSTLAQGIIAATDRGAQVINISLGGYGDSAILAQAIGYAFQRGVVVVAAAGNETYGQLVVPAAYEGVISVASVDANSRQAYFSNTGAGLDLAAPGVGVASAWETDKVAFVSGTSHSAALVAGAAAAYIGWGVRPNEIAARLKADARPVAVTTGAAPHAGILMIKPPGGR